MESRASGQESLISTALTIHKVQDMDLRKSVQPLVIYHKKAKKKVILPVSRLLFLMVIKLAKKLCVIFLTAVII